MKRADRLAVECEKMKKKLAHIDIISRDMYERGLCSPDEYLDMKLEARQLKLDLAHIAVELKLCR